MLLPATSKKDIIYVKEVNQGMTVELRPGESQESLLKRFRKDVMKSGVLSIYRRKRWYVSKSEERRKRRAKAIRKARRKQAKEHARSKRQ